MGRPAARALTEREPGHEAKRGRIDPWMDVIEHGFVVVNEIPGHGSLQFRLEVNGRAGGLRATTALAMLLLKKASRIVVLTV